MRRACFALRTPARTPIPPLICPPHRRVGRHQGLYFGLYDSLTELSPYKNVYVKILIAYTAVFAAGLATLRGAHFSAQRAFFLVFYDDAKRAAGFAPQPSRTAKNVTTNDPKLDAMSGSTLSSLWELWERVPAASASRRKEPAGAEDTSLLARALAYAWPRGI